MQKIDALSEPFEGLSLISCLGSVDDPRLNRKKLYPLKEILLTSLCAMISGIEGFRHFEIYGNEKINFLKRFYEFENGIPSHDTFARVFSLISPKEFLFVLESWVQSLKVYMGHLNHIAIDGKSMRGSRNSISPNTSAVHVVSAFASETRLVLSQAKAPFKGSGENDALFEILETLDIKGATITIDAIATLDKVASKIIEKKGHYVLSLKKNQGNMYEAAKAHFASTELKEKCDFVETVEKGHGRIEVRRYWASDDIRCFNGLPNFSGLKSMVMVERIRLIKDKEEKEMSYFVSSLSADAEKQSKLIRGHWAIENSLHWVLDVTFSEDRCRARTKNAPENMSLLRKICANLLQKIKKPGESLRSLRIRAGCNEERIVQYLNDF